MTGPRLSERPRASIKVRAALAGGLVFGVAAGLTVASWTDAERVGATFTASSFALQTSLAGGAYTPATTVAGSVSGMYPGGPASYIALLVKTTASSVAGSVRLSSAGNTVGLAPALRYRIVRSSSCTAADFGAGATYDAGGALTYQSVSTALALTAPVVAAAAAGDVVAYCIELSMAPGSAQASYQGTTTVVSWTVSGASS
jgi:predicted ribosomally synthesized peptide with SipW-like signal peptide